MDKHLPPLTPEAFRGTLASQVTLEATLRQVESIRDLELAKRYLGDCVRLLNTKDNLIKHLVKNR